jgi:hypothetical protein
MKTVHMHYLSSIYFVTHRQHVSGMFTVHHQEVFTLYVQQLVGVKCLVWLLAGSEWNCSILTRLAASLLNPLPHLFKSLLPGQEDCGFFSGHLNLHAKPETRIPYREKNYNN